MRVDMKGKNKNTAYVPPLLVDESDDGLNPGKKKRQVIP